MNRPKISIVIPVYEPTEFFAAALESISIQTYNNFEVIISDDSASDKKTKDYMAAFPGLNMRYIRNETGRGIFNNLNNAIKNSLGEFIQIFCQDDVMLDFFLMRQLELFENYPTSGLAFSRYLDIDSQGRLMPFQKHMEQAIESWKPFIEKERAINYLFVFGCLPGSLSPVMLKKDVFDKLGFFLEKYSFGGDYEFWIRTASEFDFAYNKQVSLYIRTHDKQATETLGLFKLIPDAVVLYKQLYKQTTVKVSNFKKYLHINNVVVGNLKGVLRNVFRGKFKYFKLLKYLNSFPFHLPVIILVMIHRQLKGKFVWFITEKDC